MKPTRARLSGALVAALLLAPTAALAAPGIVTQTISLKAGPGPGFPTVDRIPGGERVNIHGCLRGDAWCDVSWADDRGWVSSAYLEYLYREHYVYLPDYVDEIDIPVVSFVLGSYWSNYYVGRPWYHRREHWAGYWSSHQQDAARLTVDPRAARIGRAATHDARNAVAPPRNGNAVTVGRAGGPERAIHDRGAARISGPREIQGRAAAHMPQPLARGPAQAHFAHQPQAPHIAARPAMPHVAQPMVSHGPPMNAHAMMPAPRAAAPAAPAMPHGGGAPHVNAAPQAAAPGGGGGPGKHEH